MYPSIDSVVSGCKSSLFTLVEEATTSTKRLKEGLCSLERLCSGEGGEESWIGGVEWRSLNPSCTLCRLEENQTCKT
jgi:hypothetical protein